MDNTIESILKYSKILNLDDIPLLKEWLGNKFYIKLIYSSHTHPKEAKTFHDLCDGIANTLTIIKSDTNRKFGGFTKLPWSSSIGWSIGDGTDFIFSLDKKSKFHNTKKESAIYNHPNCFPCFGGGCDIGLLADCFINNQSAHSFFQTSYGCDSELDIHSHYYMAGNDEFGVEYLEVYKIEYI